MTQNNKSKCFKATTHEDWLEFRKGGIGSSDVATILGLSPFSTPYQLWKSKKGDNNKEDNGSEIMLLGHLLEDAIAQRWAIATGKEIIKASAGEWIYIHPEKDYFRASPDRLFWDISGSKSEDNKCVLEIKSTQKSIDPDNIPMHWYVQVQWQLFVMGMNKANLAWLTQGRDFGYVEIVRDDDFCEYVSGEVEKFWFNNVIKNEEPAITSASDIISKYRKEIAGKAAEADEVIYSAYEELRSLRSEIKALDERKNILEEKLKVAINDAESICFHGKTLATWKASADKRRFDVMLFKEEHPDLYEAYMRQEEGSRRFMLK